VVIGNPSDGKMLGVLHNYIGIETIDWIFTQTENLKYDQSEEGNNKCDVKG